MYLLWKSISKSIWNL